MSRTLSDEHVRVIRNYFNEGHGVYIWGDNDPYYADANVVAQALLGADMSGDTMGAQVVGLETHPGGVGVLRDHLLTTGLEHLYEGITIATIHPSPAMHPLLYGSAGNLVTAYYDHDGRRAILDGGFTRLYTNWDTAGTARYVKNAAAWLANPERFGNFVTPSQSPHANTSPPATPAAPTAVVPATHATPAATVRGPTASAADTQGAPSPWRRSVGMILLGAALVLGVGLAFGPRV
jgi:hypothetical protein